MKSSPRARSLCVALALCCAAWPALAPAAAQTPAADTTAPPKLTARLLALLSGYEGPSSFRGRPALVTFSPDGRWLALSAPERAVRLFDTATGEHKLTLATKRKFGLNGFAFSPDSRLAFTRDADDRTVRVWDLTTGQQKFELVGRKRDLETKLKGKGLPAEEFTPVPVSPDGATVLAEREDDLLTAFDAATGQEKQVIDHKTETNAFKDALKYMFGRSPYELHLQPVYSSDGRRLLTANGDKLPKLWEVQTGKLVATLAGHNDRVYNALFSPDSRLVATESIKGETKLWDAETGALKATFKAEGIDYSYFDPVRLYGAPSMLFSPDARTLVTYHNRPTQLWDVETGTPRQTLKKEDTNSVVISPDSRWLATDGDSRAAAQLWDLQTGQTLRSLARPDKETGLVALSPDGRVLATASDAGVKLWDAQTGALLVTLDRARAPVRFNADGRRLATGGTDKTAFLYELTQQ